MTETREPQIVAIGGRPGAPLARYLLEQTGASRPRVGFVATASGDEPAHIAKFYEIFAPLECRPSHLPLFARTPELADWVARQDVIQVGGGNTKSMLAVWRDWGLPELLHDAWQRGAVLAGSSAGAICWFEQGVTDSWAERLEALPCLGFLPGSCCPHYDGEAERRPTVHRLLADGALGTGFAIDDCAALHFRGREPLRAVAEREGARVVRVSCEAGVVSEDPLPVEVLG